MPKPPVLKPKEVIAIWRDSVLSKCGSVVLTGNIDMPMAAERQSPFMPVEIYRQFYCAKLPKILD